VLFKNKVSILRLRGFLEISEYPPPLFFTVVAILRNRSNPLPLNIAGFQVLGWGYPELGCIKSAVPKGNGNIHAADPPVTSDLPSQCISIIPTIGRYGRISIPIHPNYPRDHLAWLT
jgi:hypothetical protein